MKWWAKLRGNIISLKHEMKRGGNPPPLFNNQLKHQHNGKSKDIRREVKAAQDNRCPMCGEVSERMELHHILPVARFPELWDDRRNCVALCHDCHKEIHCNPWANIRMMEAKAAELGVDLSSRYDTRLK